MNMNYHKIKTLVIYGPFDTGKSLIANLVSNLFEPYEIGAISAPCGQTPSDIWLQDCVGKSIYRIEE